MTKVFNLTTHFKNIALDSGKTIFMFYTSDFPVHTLLAAYSREEIEPSRLHRMRLAKRQPVQNVTKSSIYGTQDEELKELKE